MTWVKLDDQFPEHPKVEAVSSSAAWLHVSAICYCNRLLTDGLVTRTRVNKLTNDVDVAPFVAELVEVGLWVECPEGWRIHDYLEFQPAREKVLADREAARLRKASWRESHRDRQRDSRVRPGGSPSVGSHSPPHPTPLPPRRTSDELSTTLAAQDELHDRHADELARTEATERTPMPAKVKGALRAVES